MAMTEAPKINIVVDSTADIPAEMVREMGITVVPLAVTFGSEGFLDGVDLSREGFRRKVVVEGQFPKTASVGPNYFRDVFRELEGEVICITLGSGYSRVNEDANVGAIEADPGGKRVTVVDSGTLSMGAGFLALKAADLARRGEYSKDQIVETVEEMKGRADVMAMLDKPDFARRGGRITALNSLLVSALKIKPLLHLEKNGSEVVSRPRGRNKAFDEMTGWVGELGNIESLAVAHFNAQEEANRLKDQIGFSEAIVTELGPTVSTHLGPGGVGICLVRRE